MEDTSEIKHKGHYMLCKQIALIPMSSTTAAPVPFPQFTPIASDPVVASWWTRKMLELDSWMGKAVKWFKLKQVMVILLPHSGLVLKDNVEKILSKIPICVGSGPRLRYTWAKVREQKPERLGTRKSEVKVCGWAQSVQSFILPVYPYHNDSDKMTWPVDIIQHLTLEYPLWQD